MKHLYTKIFLFIIIILSLSSCNNQKKEIKVIVTDYYSSLKKGDLDRMLKLFSVDIKLSYDNLYKDNAELKKFTGDTLKITGDYFDFEIIKIKIKDKKAVVTIKETGLDQNVLADKMKEITEKKPFTPSNPNDYEKVKEELATYQMTLLTEAAKEVKLKKTTTTELRLEKEKSGWVITTKDLLRVIPKEDN